VPGGNFRLSIVTNKLISPIPIEQEARRKERKKEKEKTKVCFYSNTTSLFSNKTAVQRNLYSLA